MSKSGQGKKYLNKIILSGLRERKIPYVNMMQATVDLANLFGISISGMSIIESRAAVVGCLTGEHSFRVTKIVQGYHERDIAVRKAKNLDRKANKILRVTSLPGIPSASTLERDIKEFYASWGWKRLSFDVKQERGRICECCGARPPKAVIHTDHIKPLRKYWHLRLERSNMQILCEDCNMGKGSRDETDFRALNALDTAPLEPELSDDEAARLILIKNQPRLN